jgi:tetratricopeptide (TPR) repeat protein
MSKRISILLLVSALLPGAVFAQNSGPAEDAQAIANRAVAEARAGNNDLALQLFGQALAARPDDVAILRDEAVVLGWAGKYPEAIAVADKVRSLDKNQPDWAMREFASIYLFGDSTAEAYDILDQLIRRGDRSEQTFTRRGLALRWMGRSQEAETAYRAAAEQFPKSTAAAVGLAYSIADQGRVSEAIRYLNNNSDVPATDPAVLKAKIRLLNWAGRHYEAQTMIAGLPANLQDDRDVLEDRIAASRWGGNPAGAMKDMRRFASLFPGKSSNRLWRDLRTEYGQSFSPSFRFSKDVDGLVDRTMGGDVAVHVNPAHVIHLGYQYRWLTHESDVRRLLRYEVGWSGEINRRLSFYTTAASVDYRTAGLDRKLVGDGSLGLTVNQYVRVSGGGGSITMDSYRAIPKQVTAPFGFGEIAVRFNTSTRVEARYSHYSFSDSVRRDNTNAEFMKSFFTESHMHIGAGWRSNWMWHDRASDDFWSPSYFQSHMAVAFSEGRLTRWLDYSGQVATGWQSEPNVPVMHPFQVNGKIAMHATRHWRMVLEGGKSTSSLDRALPGIRSYSRWVASAGMEFRFP